MSVSGALHVCSWANSRRAACNAGSMSLESNSHRRQRDTCSNAKSETDADALAAGSERARDDSPVRSVQLGGRSRPNLSTQHCTQNSMLKLIPALQKPATSSYVCQTRLCP